MADTNDVIRRVMADERRREGLPGRSRRQFSAYGLDCATWLDVVAGQDRVYASIELPATAEEPSAYCDAVFWDIAIGHEIRVMFLPHVTRDSAETAVNRDAGIIAEMLAESGEV